MRRILWNIHGCRSWFHPSIQILDLYTGKNYLANSFNAMADSLERSERLRREFVANVSHELKTPKEVRFGPQTDDHDFNFKKNHAISFLKDGNKVRAYVYFKGRSILFKEQGEVLLLRFANDLEEYAKVEMMPVLEKKKMTIVLAPKKEIIKRKNADAKNVQPKPQKPVVAPASEPAPERESE